MKIIHANHTHREAIIGLLQDENLPVGDLPVDLHHFFIAEQDEKVVGAIGLELYSSYGLLRSMVVRKDYRNNQIATVLVEKIESYATSLKITQLYLLTETAADYFKKKYYHTVERSNVPEAIKQSSEFSSVCPVSAAVMFKDL